MLTMGLFTVVAGSAIAYAVGMDREWTERLYTMRHEMERTLAIAKRANAFLDGSGVSRIDLKEYEAILDRRIVEALRK